MIDGNNVTIEVVKDSNVVIKRGPGRPKTKMTLKRVVLLNGKPVGRGRPSKTSSSNRKVVFIPINETYEESVHGVGKKYISGLNQYTHQIKRVDLNNFTKLTKTTNKTMVEA